MKNEGYDACNFDIMAKIIVSCMSKDNLFSHSQMEAKLLLRIEIPTLTLT